MADPTSSDDKTEAREQRKLLVRLSVLQTIPAVVGIVIACIALYAALNEADAVRKQQEAAVWPHLQVDRANLATDTDRGLTITVRNRGIGPARVRSANMFLDGEQVLSWSELFSALQPDVEAIYPRTDSYVGQSVLSPAQDVVVIDLQTSIYDTFDLSAMEGIASREQLEALILSLRETLDDDTLEMELCYCSVFDECWRVSNIVRDPQPSATCEPIMSTSEF